MSPEAILLEASTQLSLGQTELAIDLVERLLAVQPDNLDAWRIMSMIHYSKGDFAAAIGCCKNALAINADDVVHLNNLGNFLKATGDFVSARDCYQRCLRCNPDIFVAQYNLGLVQAALGESEAAINCYKKALLLQSGFADLHYSMGLEHKKLAQTKEAVRFFTSAINLSPDNFAAMIELGNCYCDSGSYESAVIWYLRALKLKPHSHAVYNNLGVALTNLGRGLEAVQYLQKASSIEPDNIELLLNLGTAQSSTNLSDSIDTFNLVLSKQPQHLDALLALSKSLLAQGNKTQALDKLRLAVTVKTDSYEAWLDLAAAAISNDEEEEAHYAFQKANHLHPQCLGPQWGLAMTQLKSFFDSSEDVDLSYFQYEKALQKLESTVLANLDRSGELFDFVVSMQFYLSLHDRNLRDVQTRVGRLTKEVVAACYGNLSARPLPPPPAPGEKIRVGFVSHHFNVGHSVWKINTQGWSQLDRDRFHVSGYSTAKIPARSIDQIKQSFDNLAEMADGGFAKMVQTITADAPHVLIYPAIGMDPYSNRLAALRLAPIQCAGWGCPITTGLPTVDFYLFNELFGNEHSQEEYTEKLIRLAEWGSFYTPALVKPTTATLADYGVRMEAKRFLCLQTPHKYLPQYDEVFPRIALAVPAAQFLFARAGTAVAGKLENRLARVFSNFGLNAASYVTFLPELNPAEYLGLCSVGEVFLDTALNSGLTTTVESFEVGCVPVTLASQSAMRACQTKGLLQAMGVTETMANTLDQYVQIAVRLVQQPDRRSSLSQTILARKHLLHRRESVIKSLEDFLINAVQTLGRQT